MTINIPEFEAMLDVLDDTIGEVALDRLEPAEAIDVRRAIEQVMSKARDAIWAIDQSLVKRIERGSIIRDGFEYTIAPNGKWVWDHDDIAKQVATEASRPDENGVVPTAHRAAAEAARMMRQIYASDATQAKMGKMQSFGLDPRDFRDFVGAEGRKVVKKPTTTPEDAP